VSPNGRDLRALTHPPLAHSDWDGGYSPDGAKVLFDSDRRYDDFCCGDLFTIDADGANMQRARLPYDAYDPRWDTAPLLPASAQMEDPASDTSPGGSVRARGRPGRHADVCIRKARVAVDRNGLLERS
jgi:hypothetical protein